MGLGGVCYMHVGIFDLEHVKVILDHLVHFSKSWAVTQKRLIIDQNGQNWDHSVYFLKKGDVAL